MNARHLLFAFLKPLLEKKCLQKLDKFKMRSNPQKFNNFERFVFFMKSNRKLSSRLKFSYIIKVVTKND